MIYAARSEGGQMPNDLDLIRARVDEQGRVLNSHGEAIDSLTLVVLGDTARQIKGLLQRTNELEIVAEEIRGWRRDMETTWRVALIYLRIAVGILALSAIGDWKSALEAIFKALAGG